MGTEEEVAAFYQAQKDDPEVWGDVVAPPSEAPRRRELSATITIRLNPEEAALIRKLAKDRGKSYSDIVRAAVDAVLYPRVVLEPGDVVNYAFGKPLPTAVPSAISLQFDKGESSKTGSIELLVG